MNDPDFAAIAARDDLRVKAMLATDIDEVEKYIGTTLRYVHGSGTDEDRSVYLQRLREGHYRYHMLESKRREFRRIGDLVLVHGDVRIGVTVNKTEKEFTSRYLQVWTNEAGQWMMVAWQTTPLPTS